jgi:putative endonuclease
MADHNELGKQGEQFAVDFLQNNGYEIFETNWVYQKAEVDIIAKKENILAIVEVKTRSSIAFGLPQDFVKPKKVKLLVKAVDAYIQNNNLDLEVRFDIIAIHKNGTNLSIEHLEDAFHYF